MINEVAAESLVEEDEDDDGCDDGQRSKEVVVTIAEGRVEGHL